MNTPTIRTGQRWRRTVTAARRAGTYTVAGDHPGTVASPVRYRMALDDADPHGSAALPEVIVSSGDLRDRWDLLPP